MTSVESEWEKKFSDLCDVIISGDVDQRLDALKDYIQFDINRTMQDRKKLIEGMMPSVIAIDLAVRTVFVSATCKSDKELRFVVDLVARLVCCGNAKKYDAFVESTKTAGCEWDRGAIEPDSVQAKLLQCIPDYLSEFERYEKDQSNQSKKLAQLEAQAEEPK